MTVEKYLVGRTMEKTKIYGYHVFNSQIAVTVMDLGACVTSFLAHSPEIGWMELLSSHGEDIFTQAESAKSEVPCWSSYLQGETIHFMRGIPYTDREGQHWGTAKVSYYIEEATLYRKEVYTKAIPERYREMVRPLKWHLEGLPRREVLREIQYPLVGGVPVKPLALRMTPEYGEKTVLDSCSNFESAVSVRPQWQVRYESTPFVNSSEDEIYRCLTYRIERL